MISHHVFGSGYVFIKQDAMLAGTVPHAFRRTFALFFQQGIMTNNGVIMNHRTAGVGVHGIRQ
jgi:hypothetical protein